MRRFFSHVPADESRAVLLSLVVGVSLLVVKFVAYFLTGSRVTARHDTNVVAMKGA